MKKTVLGAALGCALVLGLAARADAAIVVTYSYSGSATVGGATSTLTTVSPTNTATRYQGAPPPSAPDTRDRAALINFGSVSPFVFAAGSAVQGTASASGTLTLNVDITNDSGVAQDFTWQGLIFAGGLGFVVPSGGDICRNAIEACTSIQNLPFTVDPGESAALSFAASLAGVSLFSGEASVNSAGATSSFNNIALNGFGPTASNANFLSWDSTTFSQSLGNFAVGETKTLTFVVTVSTTLLNTMCTDNAPVNCLLALAGFGDPPGGGGSGGVVMDGGSTTNAMALTFVGPTSQAPPTPQVPLPTAALLFIAGLAGLSAKLKRAR
jgi:hypothetical protein